MVEAKNIVLLPSDEIEKRSNPPTPEVKENGPPKLDGMQEKKSTTSIAEEQEPEKSALEQKLEETPENKAATPVTEALKTEVNNQSQPQINGDKENGQAPEGPKTVMAEKLESEKPTAQPETKAVGETKEEKRSENIDQTPDTEEHKLTQETEKDYDKLVAELLEEENVEANDNQLAPESTEEQESKTNNDEGEAEPNEVDAKGEANEKEAETNYGETEAKEEDDTELEQREQEAIDKNDNELADEPEEDAPEKNELETETETEEKPLDEEGGNEDESANVELDTENEDLKGAETEEDDEPVKNEPQPDTDVVDKNQPAETLPDD